MQLPERTILVTGGASGLGLATARRLVAAQANVAVVDLPTTAHQASVDELGPRASLCVADVTNAEQLSASIAAAQSRFGPLRGVICCAGVLATARLIGRDGPHSLELFEHVVRVNLIGAFNTIRLAAAAMSQNALDESGERGVIVTVASVAATEGQVGQTAYAAAKGGVAAMTLPIARELSRHAIRIVSVAPGVFETPMTAALPEEARQSLLAQTVFPERLGQPDEFAQLVQQILENSMLNGAVIRLDGAVRLAAR